MSTRYARLRPQMTADEAIAFLRRQARDKIETIYYAYVVDPDHRLSAWSRSAICSPPIEGHGRRDHGDRGRPRPGRGWIRIRYRGSSRTTSDLVPVVDSTGRMKGIVTVDDIVDSSRKRPRRTRKVQE